MATLVGGLLLILALICEACNENTIERKIVSDSELIETLQEIEGSLLQNVCYSLLFSPDAIIELNLNQTFSISSNVSLQGHNTTIKCTISSSYDYSGIISVNNAEKFDISDISFIACPSTFIRFENVSNITILRSEFR